MLSPSGPPHRASSPARATSALQIRFILLSTQSPQSASVPDWDLKMQLLSFLETHRYTACVTSCPLGYETGAYLRAEPDLLCAGHHQSSPSPSSSPQLGKETCLVFKDIPPASLVPQLCDFKAFFCAAIKGCEKTWKGNPGWYRQLEQGAICAQGRGGGGRAHSAMLNSCRGGNDTPHYPAFVQGRDQNGPEKKKNNKKGLFWLAPLPPLPAAPVASYWRPPPHPCSCGPRGIMA